MSNLYNVKW